MARVEFEGQDLSEAIVQAAAALNIPPETLKFAVISMGTKGFLGLGRRKARISVNPDDPTLDLGDDAPAMADRPAAPEPVPAEPASDPTPPVPNPAGKTRHTERTATTPPEPGEGRVRAENEPESEAGPGPARDAGRRNSKPSAPPLELDWAHLPPPPSQPGPGETLIPDAAGPAAAAAVAVVREIVGHMGFTAEVTCGRLGQRLFLSLDSPDNALLIGSRGATLEALQLLAAKILTRRLAAEGLENEGAGQLVLDVADYRARRQRHLLDLLKNLAQEARQTRRPQTLSGLNAAERRLVQMALRPFKDLSLRSGGRDSLIIAPAQRRR